MLAMGLFTNGIPAGVAKADTPAPDVWVPQNASSPLDNITTSLAVDSFYLVDWNAPSDPAATSGLPHRAFDFTNGFGLAFAALDAAYEGDDVGITINLRFGEGANRLIGNPENPAFAVLKQAYATWKPCDDLTLDVGQFDTIYGAEVADSWQNLNYTRGALYFLMQPFYHTGLRAAYQLSDSAALTFLVVNGTNNQIDNNQSPHVGAQLGLAPSDNTNLAVGYYGGAGSSGFDAAGNASDTGNDADWEHFFDLVFTTNSGIFSLVGNADLYFSSDSDMYWGVSLAGSAQVTPTLALALRGEHLSDPDLFISGAYKHLTTGTFTIDHKPSDNLIIRLDNRIELAESAVFPTTNGTSETWFSTTLGLVVTTN